MNMMTPLHPMSNEMYKPGSIRSGDCKSKMLLFEYCFSLFLFYFVVQCFAGKPLQKIEDVPLHYMSSTKSYASNLSSLAEVVEFENHYHFAKPRMKVKNLGNLTSIEGDYYHKKIDRYTFISPVQDSALTPSCLSNITFQAGDSQEESQVLSSEKIMSSNKRLCRTGEDFVDFSDGDFSMGTSNTTRSKPAKSALSAQLRRVKLNQACDILEDFMLPALKEEHDSDDCASDQNHSASAANVNIAGAPVSQLDDNESLKKAVADIDESDGLSDSDDECLPTQLRNSLGKLINLAHSSSISASNSISSSMSGISSCNIGLELSNTDVESGDESDDEDGWTEHWF